MTDNIDKLPRFDISNEAWRDYVYGDGRRLHVEGARTLILEKRPDGDRHRLIIKEKDSDREVGMYVAPGWVAVMWQTPDGKHGMTF